MAERIINHFESSDGKYSAKVYCESGNQEYIVKLFISGKHRKQDDYFTDSMEDALMTGAHMLQQAEIKKNPASIGPKWKKIFGVVQPGGIYQFGLHGIFIYPPNDERESDKSKYLLIRGKQIIGAYGTLSAAKRALPDMLFTAYDRNPAPFRGTSKPRRVSQITKITPTKRLVKRRKMNTEQGYFPNPDTEFPYVIQQRAKGRVDNVCAASHRKIAETLITLLMENAAPGVLFTIEA